MIVIVFKMNLQLFVYYIDNCNERKIVTDNAEEILGNP